MDATTFILNAGLTSPRLGAEWRTNLMRDCVAEHTIHTTDDFLSTPLGLTGETCLARKLVVWLCIAIMIVTLAHVCRHELIAISYSHT
ncbi:hypothetical protein OPQ81_009008 [Rhizoctonia solani]|nr:hypothetical protein OPQ81_009008 [Rhizoctonia solani]